VRRFGALLAAFLLCQVTVADIEKMQSMLLQHGGSSTVFRDWRQLIDDSRALGARDRLRRVNEFFNRKIQFVDDIQVWGQTDYWAT
ncbi:hypothetical protein ACYTX7_09745, partial [Streptococcus pyogenes]